MLSEVPSILIPEEMIYLLNPEHPDMARVTVRKIRRWTYGTGLPSAQVAAPGVPVATEPALTTAPSLRIGEIAVLIGVSAPTVSKMLDRGTIPSSLTPDGHRRALRADVVAWHTQQQRERQSLRAMIQASEDHEVQRAAVPPGVVDNPNREDEV